jgi:hypothetical protein
MTGLSRRRTRGRAYSDRYTAAPRPTGTATTMAMAVTSKVPTTRVEMS